MLNYVAITVLMPFVATFGAPMMLKWFADSWDSTAVCLCCIIVFCVSGVWEGVGMVGFAFEKWWCTQQNA